MATSTFNAGIDYFGLETSAAGKVKCTSSNENRSKQSTSGANTYGDAAVVDSWGETAAPSAEYTVIAELTKAGFPALGAVNTDTEGFDKPVVIGSLTINTSNGNAPTLSVSGQVVQTGAKTLRDYKLPDFTLSPRHRAQDFLSFCTIKTGTTDASDIDDYGLENVSATFPIEITLAQPKGEVKNYDLHGGMATCNYTMNWYAATAPTIVLTTEATTRGATMSAPVDKSCPEGGYTQYTWTVSFPMKGVEHTGA